MRLYIARLVWLGGSGGTESATRALVLRLQHRKKETRRQFPSDLDSSDDGMSGIRVTWRQLKPPPRTKWTIDEKVIEQL